MVDDPKFRPTPKRKRSGSETRQRTATLPPIRCTPEQRDALTAAADKAGLSLSAYVLAATLNAKPPRAARVPPVNRAMLAQALGLLGRLNGNVNQIARSINYRQHPELYDLRDVPVLIEQLGRELMAALGKGRRLPDEPAPEADDLPEDEEPEPEEC
jgi:hypothetical protein